MRLLLSTAIALLVFSAANHVAAQQPTPYGYASSMATMPSINHNPAAYSYRSRAPYAQQHQAPMAHQIYAPQPVMLEPISQPAPPQTVFGRLWELEKRKNKWILKQLGL